VKTISDKDKEYIVKSKKTGIVLTLVGGMYLIRTFLYLKPNLYMVAFFASFIISIISAIIGLKGKKVGGLIALVSGILNSLIIIFIVSHGNFQFFMRLYYGLIYMFLTIQGFGFFGIPFLLILIGGIISFIESNKKNIGCFRHQQNPV